MQKVGIRHGKRGKAVETLINRAPSAGLVSGGRPFGGGRLDGWTLWEFTLPRYRDHRTLSAHCNFYQLKIQLATELPLRTFSLDHFSKHVWSSPQSPQLFHSKRVEMKCEIQTKSRQNQWLSLFAPSIADIPTLQGQDWKDKGKGSRVSLRSEVEGSQSSGKHLRVR